MVSPLASLRASVLSALSSQRALAASLVAGAMLVTGALPMDAQAQRNKKKEETEQPAQEQNSAAFAAAYRPLAEMVTNGNKNWQGAAAGVPTLVAAIENNRDRSVAGSFLLQAGTNTGNDALRRQGLELMYQSGLMSANDKPLIAFNLGVFAYQAREMDTALEYFLAARDAGYRDNDNEPFNDVEYLILQTYATADRNQEALAFGMPIVRAAQAAGTPAADPFIRQTLQAALDLDDGPSAREAVAHLVMAYPSDATWQLATRITVQYGNFSEVASLDVYRLMRLVGALEDRREYSNYISAANENLRPVEILDVLDEGIAKGAYPADDEYVRALRNQVAPTARRQRASIDDAYADARQGGGNNADVLALNVGDQLLALNDYDRAIAIYEIAQSRNFDANVIMTRIGMAQVLKGDVAAGKATLANVTGANKPIADLWTLYADIEAVPMAAADAASEAAEAAAEVMESAS